MVIVPLRAVPVFCPACQLTVPVPVPLLPDVIVSQLEALLVVVQLQLEELGVTVTLPLLPEGTELPVGWERL